MQKQNIHLAVDAVVFGVREQSLHVLLIRRKIPPHQGRWALPGGFVLDGESLEQAVQRELHEETNVSIHYLEQLYTFGDPGRDPRFRVVSVSYFALVPPDQFSIAGATDAAEARWYDVKALPKLAFDHRDIVSYAVERLRGKLTYQPIGFELLPKSFRFSELETLYTTILDRSIDRRNFRKKVMGFGILEQLPTRVSEGRGRPGTLFRFNQKRYFHLKKQGFVFEL